MNIASLAKQALSILVISIALSLPLTVHAEREPWLAAQHMHYDTLHGHNHYYPDRGVVVRTLPAEAHPVTLHGSRYWFHEGIWYQASGRQFVVAAPPIGVFVPFLPAFATSLMIGGATYYYANDAYYLYHQDTGQYEVVAAPPGLDDATSTVAVPASTTELFAYPKNGQSANQQTTDRYECGRWAVDQTGFDPTAVDSATAPQSKRADYVRAQQACLEGRGYSMRPGL